MSRHSSRTSASTDERASTAQPIRVQMLRDFTVTVGDAEPVAEWPRRRPAELLQLLALSEGTSLSREQVIEALWPDLTPEAGAANLRKAAHHARRALDADDAVVLKGGRVALFPDRELTSDLNEFLARSTECLRAADEAGCAELIDSFGGELLPGSLYAEWTQAPRELVHSRRASLLAAAGEWEELFALDPTDERVCRELMRAALADGRRHAAIRWFSRLRSALRSELGAVPSEGTQELYARCIAGLGHGEPEFVGRDLELALAGEALAAAARAELGALLLSGPAGIGKTTMVKQVAARARESGWIVLQVAATEDAVPYAPLAAAVEQLLGRDRSALEELPAASRSALAELTALAGPAEPHDGTLTRHQVIGAVRRLLALTVDATGAGVMLIVDDAHRADDASTEVIRHLVSGGGVPFLSLLSYRGEAAGRALDDFAEASVRGGRATRLEMGPLDPAEVREIALGAAPATPGPEALDRIVGLAEGNPFFARELARAGGQQGDPTAVAATLWEAIAARFVDMGEEAREDLARLAVAGESFDLPTVLALTGLSEEAASLLLDEALGRELLVVSDPGYRFRHELVRQALAQPLPQHRRVAIHREAAERLSEADAAPAAIARHWLAGERPERAREWLLAAAREAIAVGAYADALAQLELLVEVAPEDPDGLCLKAEVLDYLGDRDAPSAYATAATIVGETAAHELRPREAFARIKAGDPAGAMEVLDGVRPQTPVGRICEALTISAAAAIGFLDDLELASAKAEEAYRLALELDESWAMLEASWAYALAAHARGELPARLREYLRSSQAMPELATRLFDGQLCVTERLLYGGLPYPEVVDFADSLAAEAQRLGAKRGEAFALTLRGEARMLSGDLPGAEADLGEGERLHRHTAAAAGTAVSLQGRALVRLREGKASEARPLAVAALSHARESNVGYHTFDRIYGTLVASAEDPAAGRLAVEEAEAAIRGPAETCPTCRITFLVPAAIATARAGDLERARSYAEATAGLISFASLPPAWDAASSEVRGHLARAEGDADAERHFREAAAQFAQSGQPHDERRCTALAAGGDGAQTR